MSSSATIDISGSDLDVTKWIWRNLVPKSGQSGTVQGEALRAIEKLRWEAQKNGNINWDEGFELLIEFLRHFFAGVDTSTQNSIESDLDRLQNFLSPFEFESREDADKGPYVHDDLYDRLTEHLIAFCRQNPAPIARDHNPTLRR